MDVIVVFNGLGNQMSQYAFYLQKKAINHSTYLISFSRDHNGLEIDSLFKTDWRNDFVNKLLYYLFRILIADRFKIVIAPVQYLLRYLGCSVRNENYNYNYNPSNLIPAKGITFYFGGWHNEKYFENVKSEVLDAFNFIKELDEVSADLLSKIAEETSVSLHVRRGDFLNAANINLFGRVCTKAYFEKAIQTINDNVKDPNFYVFSNDMDWVKKNLVMDRAIYITHNVGSDSWKDLFLMSHCKHNIISNSSFSWWGAWLNGNKDKIVVSPAKFLNTDTTSDIYPETWIKIFD